MIDFHSFSVICLIIGLKKVGRQSKYGKFVIKNVLAAILI